MKRVKISDMMRIIKPIKGIYYTKLCFNYAKEVNDAIEKDGHYELSGSKTKSGNPVVFGE